MRERMKTEEERGETNRNIDDEDALPGENRDEHATEDRACHHAECDERGEHAHGAAALACGERLGDDAHVVGHGGSVTDALDDARDDEDRQVRRKAAKQRADREDEHARLEHADLAEAIAGTTERKNHNARGEQVER